MDAYNQGNNKMGQNLDSQLWHGIAGKLVKLPTVNSRVLYFPQGHAEHAADGPVDFKKYLDIPSYITCKVSSVDFLADPDSDEIYAKIGLTPIDTSDDVYGNDDKFEPDNNRNKLLSFSKTLTQSDANNGGGFTVPKAGAERLFLPIDSKAELSIKDVHGKIYIFRHTYTGTPQRHLFTTGWSLFVNDKELAAKDSVMFFKRDSGELCVAIRRKKKFVKAGEKELGWRKLESESVIQAARLAADGKPFEVVYYPRTGLPEFCVKADVVWSALRFNWRCGMRFKMPYEVENCVEPSWAMGTITSVEAVDPIRWPNSKWRTLQVRMDKPEVVQNETSFSPWSVEPIADKPHRDLSYLNPPRGKRLKTLPRYRPLVDHLSVQQSYFLNYPYMGSSAVKVLVCGMQGTRQFSHQRGTFLPNIAPLVNLNGARPNGSVDHSSPESNNENSSDLPKLVIVEDTPPNLGSTNTTCFKIFGFELPAKQTATKSSSNIDKGALIVGTRNKENLERGGHIEPFSNITNKKA